MDGAKAVPNRLARGSLPSAGFGTRGSDGKTRGSESSGGLAIPGRSRAGGPSCQGGIAGIGDAWRTLGRPGLEYPATVSASRILLVEDDPTTREHLSRSLQEADGIQLVGAVASLAEARALLAEVSLDVLLTDLDLPDGSGLELVREVSGRDGVVPLVITVFADERHVIAAIRAGAMGYLLKDQKGPDVIQAVRNAVDGGAPISPEIAAYLLREVRGAEERPDPGPVPQLSAREREVLRCIVRGFTYDEIAGLLEISAHTVSTHIRKIYRKLAVHSRGEAVYEALQLGLVHPDD